MRSPLGRSVSASALPTSRIRGRRAHSVTFSADCCCCIVLSIRRRAVPSRLLNELRGADEVEEVYAKDQRHPGALHYLIHAYDDPIHAPLGLRAARLYGKVAPAASHAQHMPSHIFFALGLWDDAIAANVASLRIARAQNDGGYHSLVWLTYA